MSKKTQILIEAKYVEEQASAKALRKSADDLKKSLTGIIDPSAQSELASYIDEFSKIDQMLDGLGGSMSPRAFDEMSKSLQKVTKNYEKTLTKMSKAIKVEVDSKAIDELDDKIEKSEKKITSLNESLAIGKRVSTKGGRQVLDKEVMDTAILKDKNFEGYAGSSDTLGIQHLDKGLKNLKALDNATEKYRKTLIKLQNQKETGQISNDESKKLAEMQAELGKVAALEKIIKTTTKAHNEEATRYEQNKKDLIAENLELEKNIALRKKKEDAAGAGPRKEITDARDAAGQEHRKQAGDASRQKTHMQDQHDKVTADKLNTPIPSIGEKGLNTMLEQYFSVNAALKVMQNMVRKTIDTISDLDAAFVSIAVVTQYTNKEVWGMYESFNKIASSAGFTVAEIGQVAAEYFRQGESFSNVITLTEAAAKAAQVAGIDASESVRYLTSAVKGYNLAASDAMLVSDKFAAVAANSATSYEGLATAMSKVAAQASANNVEMDNLMGMMATSMEVTQEAPENIGTAFKTILARMSEIKDYGKVLEDGMDANRIEKALKTVNVQLFDQQNEMRALDTVLLEVGNRWGTLNRSQKAYIATSLAGTRQQTRLLAVLENMEMTKKNIATSQGSEGATEAQQLKNTESIAFNLNRINVAFESMTKNLSNSNKIIGIVKGLATIFEGIAKATDSTAGKTFVYSTALIGVAKAMKMLKKVDWLRDLLNSEKSLKALSKSVGGLAPQMGQLGAATTTASKAMVLLGTATKLLSWVAITVAVAGFVGWMLKLANPVLRAEKAIKKASEATEELKAKMYDLKQEKKTINELSDEFAKLDRKVLKTNEDMERQTELLQLLEDSDIDSEYLFANADGSLNYSEIQRRKDDIAAQEEKNFKDRLREGLILAEKYDNISDRADKYTANQAKAIETIADGSLEAWNKVDAEVQAMAIEWERLANETTVLRGADGEIYNGETKQQSIGEGQTYTTDMEGNALTQGKLDAPTPEAIEQWQKYKDSVDLSTISVQQYNQDVLGMEGASFIAQEALSQMAAKFDHLGNTSMNALARLGDFFGDTEANGVTFSDSLQRSMASAFDEGRPEAFFNMLQTGYARSEDTVFSFGDAMRQMVDLFDEVPEDVMLDNLVTFDSFSNSIQELNNDLDNFNSKSLAGVFELLDAYSEVPEVLDMITDSILETGEISDEVQAQMLASKTETTKQMILDEIAQNKIRIGIAQEELKMLKKAAADDVALKALANKQEIEISGATAAEIVNHMVKLGGSHSNMLQGMVEEASRAGIAIKNNLTDGGGYDFTKNKASIDQDFSDEGVKARIQAMADVVAAEAKSVGEEINLLENKNKMLQHAYDNMGTETGMWNKSRKEAEAANKKANKAAKKESKDNEKAAEEYLGVLNKLYITKKKLELVDWSSDLLQSQQALIESANAIKGLEGAQNSLAGTSLADVVQDQHGVLEQQKDLYKELAEVTKSYQKDLESGLSPALKGAYKIYQGQIIPVSSQYKKLTYAQMKELDEFAASFNDLGKEVNGYTSEILKAEKAQNDLIASMRDKVIEYQKLMISAIKNEEKKQIESFKKIIDANKKHLDERKKLYQDAFSEEDKDSEQDDIEEKRRKIIEKLANLESAHDLTSIQKREQYRKELKDLDEQFNLIALERNREALLKSLDNQSQYQEDLYQKEEEAYNARISSGEWLEERMKQIQDDARIQAILDTMGQHWTLQNMIDNHYITREDAERIGMIDINTTVADLLKKGLISQDQISELGIKNINKTVKTLMDKGVVDQFKLKELGLTTENTMVGDLNDEQTGIIKDAWKKNRDIIDQAWNGAEGVVGIEALIEAAGGNILTYLTNHATEMEETTTIMKDKLLSEWSSLIDEVATYTKNFNGVTLTGPKYGNVTKTNKELLTNIKNTTDGAVNHYKRLVDQANKAIKAINDANNKPIVQRVIPAPIEQKPSGTTTTKTGGKRNYNPNESMNIYATGGTTARTGLHWLDGKPGAPERVLSAGANKQFENLLGALTLESKHVTQNSGVSDNGEIVSSLMTVVKAVYDSGQESANAITKAIDRIDLENNGISIKAVANKHGVSLNRRGDK